MVRFIHRNEKREARNEISSFNTTGYCTSIDHSSQRLNTILLIKSLSRLSILCSEANAQQSGVPRLRDRLRSYCAAVRSPETSGSPPKLLRSRAESRDFGIGSEANAQQCEVPRLRYRFRSYCAAERSPETSGSILPPSTPPRR